MSETTSQEIREFIRELSGFAATAEDALKRIESDPGADPALFSMFVDRMLAIRGTAQQLQLADIARIAGLGEEIAARAQTAGNRAQIRKSVGALWDALTTVKYLLEHHGEPTFEEQDILINRLQATLKSLGGARETMSSDEIEALLNQGSTPT